MTGNTTSDASFVWASLATLASVANVLSHFATCVSRQRTTGSTRIAVHTAGIKCQCTVFCFCFCFCFWRDKCNDFITIVFRWQSFLFSVIATLLLTYPIVLCREVMPLEEFFRTPIINTMNKILKSAIPACSLHRDQPLEIYCRDCKQEACHSCWT